MPEKNQKRSTSISPLGGRRSIGHPAPPYKFPDPHAYVMYPDGDIDACLECGLADAWQGHHKTTYVSGDTIPVSEIPLFVAAPLDNPERTDPHVCWKDSVSEENLTEALDIMRGISVDTDVNHDLGSWADLAHGNSILHGFWDNSDGRHGERIDPGTKLLLMIGEIMEAHEGIRDHHRPDAWWINPPDHPTHPNKPDGPAIEIADLFIRMMDYCGHYGIDVGCLARLKHEYNISRPRLHGKTV